MVRLADEIHLAPVRSPSIFSMCTTLERSGGGGATGMIAWALMGAARSESIVRADWEGLRLRVVGELI
jgi:hypothetical protein